LLERKPLRRIYWSWRERHLQPLNFAIHMVGIPLTVIGIAMLFVWPWYYGVLTFIFGYLLQYIGHLIEGNEMGEWILIKRIVGRA